MVHRRSLIGAGALAALVAATPAGAVSRKVAIGDFQWSQPQVTIDRGDSVTWFWIGPDTQHSVTGLSDNALALDSDPGNGAPDHTPGDRFSLTFDTPGTYAFHCKLHAIVRGTVVVTDTPGTGAPSPDADPQVTEDLVAPELTDARLNRGRTELRYTLDERARVTLDVMRVRRGPDRLRGTRRFAGHIGWNTRAFRGWHLAPGRYRVLLVAADAANNHSGDVAVPFRVSASSGRRGSSAARRAAGRRR